MSSRLSQRLSAAWRSNFIGRTAEQELFLSEIRQDVPSHNILYLYGPGGVGKTTLLKQYYELAQQAGAQVVYLDARNMEPSPLVFLTSLARLLELSDASQLFDHLAQFPGTTVILLDTFETLVSLDDWLRVAFLPYLPEKSLVVLATRFPPSAAWRTDPGWSELMQVMPLRNFAPDETRAYLSHRAIPEEQQAVAINFTHGHPLALCLVAEAFAQRPATDFIPEAAPDIVRALVEKFVQEVPGPQFRVALEACALVRVTTEAVLARMLDIPDAHELFDWLRALSFMETRRGGLFPHDLAREAIVSDLRWRNPDQYIELHRRAREYYFSRLDQVGSVDQQRLLFDLIYLHRDNPAVRPYFEWQAAALLLTDQMRLADLAVLRGLVEKFEGSASAELAMRWLQRFPQWVVVLRASQSEVAGFYSWLELNQLSAEEIDSDPALAACQRYLQTHAPLRAGERACVFRFWMASDTYQDVSQVQSILFINIVRYYLTTPGLAHTFVTCADPLFWSPAFAYGDIHRLEAANYQVGGRSYGVFGHDWRARPPLAWLDLLAERELGGSAPLEPATPNEETLLVLSRAEFEGAVRELLRSFAQPLQWQDNPLLRSRLVADAAGPGQAARVEALRRAVFQAAEALKSSPRSEKLHRALDRTYLHPAPTQEIAAELLDLPFSTYRRHLKAGIEMLTEALWQREIAA